MEWVQAISKAIVQVHPLFQPQPRSRMSPCHSLPVTRSVRVTAPGCKSMKDTRLVLFICQHLAIVLFIWPGMRSSFAATLSAPCICIFDKQIEKWLAQCVCPPRAAISPQLLHDGTRRYLPDSRCFRRHVSTLKSERGAKECARVHTVCGEQSVRGGGGAQLQSGAHRGQHMRDSVQHSRIVHVLQAVHLQLQNHQNVVLTPARSSSRPYRPYALYQHAQLQH